MTNILKFVIILLASFAAVFSVCRLLNKQIKLSEMQKTGVFACLAAVCVLLYFFISDAYAFYCAAAAAGGALTGWSAGGAYSQ